MNLKTPLLNLRSAFPDVWFQGKGLTATEGPMTIPWISSKGSLPLLNHTYFDFVDQSRNKQLLHQLLEGEEYEILPRFPNIENQYDIGDKVLCTGHYHKTPTLEFIGRKGDTSDMVGEKLSGNLLREIFALDFLDFVVIANNHEKNYSYTIIAESRLSSDRRIKKSLRANFKAFITINLLENSTNLNHLK